MGQNRPHNEEQTRKEIVDLLEQIIKLKEKYKQSLEKDEIFEVLKGYRTKINNLHSRIQELESKLSRIPDSK